MVIPPPPLPIELLMCKLLVGAVRPMPTFPLRYISPVVEADPAQSGPCALAIADKAKRLPKITCFFMIVVFRVRQDQNNNIMKAKTRVFYRGEIFFCAKQDSLYGE